MTGPSRFKSPIIVPAGESRIKVNHGPFDDPRIKDFISLGMPHDDPRVSIQWAGEYFDSRFQGYTLELFGAEPDPDSVRNHPLEFWQTIGVITPHQVVYKQPSPGHNVVGSFCVWACRVRRDDKLVFEETWNPKAGWVQTINNIWIQDSDIATQLIRLIENEKPSSATVLPDDESLDYGLRWRNYLSYGYRRFSEGLLAPGIAFVFSPDLSKGIAIGDASNNPLFKYDEAGRAAYFDVCGKGDGTRFSCPACKQSYIIASGRSFSLITEGIINIHEGDYFFDCACGVVFNLIDRYEHLSLPFRRSDLAPLFQVGMSQTADLFVRYLLSPDGHTLVEEVGVVTQHTPQDMSLTEIPMLKFANWCGLGPGFVSAWPRLHAYHVQIWRKRVYELGAETFEELTPRSFQGGWVKVVRTVKEHPDNFANEKLLDLLSQTRLSQQVDTQTKKSLGGDRRTDETKQLWGDLEVLKGYARKVDELWPIWTMIKSMTHRCGSEESQREWVTSVLERPIIKGFVESFSTLTEDVLRRAVDDKLNAAARQPHLLACHHAGLEFEVNIDGVRLSLIGAYFKQEGKVPAPSTLKTLYDKGKALLRE